LEALLHGCRELLDKKWTLNEQSMVQIQKVLSKHRALNQIVLHNHYYQKHALKINKNTWFNLNFLNNVSCTGKFSPTFDLKKMILTFSQDFSWERAQVCQISKRKESK
jgi:hypothetical protein